LRFSRQSEFAEQYPQRFVELLVCEFEAFAIGVQYVEYFLLVFAEVLSEDGFVDAFDFDDVFCDGIGVVFLDESFGDVVCDGELGFFVEHEDEEFGLFGLFLVLVDFVQFVHQFAVSWVVAETDAV
jgi:hypothetical protein